MLRVRALPLVIFIVLASLSCGAGTARGVAFEDRNGNGVRDAGEPGLAGVAVSNGLDVVLSDDEGRYELAVEEGTVLFVTKPSGYQVPLGPDLLPRHYYIHDPDGTPEELGLRYPGVEPSGRLPRSVDFPLRAVEEPDRFDVIWFADPQTKIAEEVEFLRDDVVAELAGVEAAFGLTAGDIVYDEPSLYPPCTQVIALAGIPWHNIPGNHDLNLQAADDAHGRETFKRHFGPPYYSFDYGQAHFVVLDNVHYLGRGQAYKSPHSADKISYEGRIEGEQLAWLANDLRHVPADRLVVIGMHIPLRCAVDPLEPDRNVLQRAGLFEVLKDREHLLLVAGHMHTAEHHYFDGEDGWEGDTPLHQHTIATASGSWWSGPPDERGIPVSWQRDGTPNGYYVMTVDGNRATMRFKAASEPAGFQMRIAVDPGLHEDFEREWFDFRTGRQLQPAVRRDRLGEAELLVNLFDGGPRSTVEYRIDDGPAAPMTRVARPDPFFEDHFIRYEDLMRSWVGLEPSSHVWAAPLPETLRPGRHTLTVRAVDEYGREHTAQEPFEVVGQ